jgi:glycosyltransferase involved in cell wall biosynthesis
MAEPLAISVVIPVRDRPEAVRRAIASALAQTLPAAEVVVVDDASAPPLRREEIAPGDAPVRLLRHEAARGAAGARQAGVEAARGEIVAFLDSDDVWLPGKLARQMPVMAAALARGEGLVAVACGWETRPEAGGTPQRRIPLASADPLDFASGCWFSPGSTVLLPRAAFASIGPFDATLRRLEDLDWFLRFALAGGRLAVVPEALVLVSTGRRSRRAALREAARRILARHADAAPLPRGLRRRLRAYLALEYAAAARNEGRWLETAATLAASFALAPRGRLPLRQWWI